MSEILKLGIRGIVPAKLSIEKSSSEYPHGELNGYSSLYNVVDDQDDVALPGMFNRTLARWKQAGRYVPLMDGHTNSNDKVLGSFKRLIDDNYGLASRAAFSSSPLAQQRRQEVKDGHISGLSIFGDVLQKKSVKVGGQTKRGLVEVHLLHIALTPGPALFDASATAKSNDIDCEVIDIPWAEPVEKSSSICALTKGDDHFFPHHMPDGKANINAVRKALEDLPSTNLTDEEKETAKNHLEEHVEKFQKDSALPELWVADMRAALTIGNPIAQKLAVDTLIKEYRKPKDGVSTVTYGSINDDKPAVEKSTAADYALSIISGFGENPSASNSGDPLADIMNASSHETDIVVSDLDRLEKELLGGS